MFSAYMRRLAVVYVSNVVLVAFNFLLWSYQPPHRPTSGHVSSNAGSILRSPAEPEAVWRPIGDVAKPPMSDALWEATRTEAIGNSVPAQVPLQPNNEVYQVPSIERTSVANCAAMLAGDVTEMSKVAKTIKVRPKVPIYEETYLDWIKDCAAFRARRGYVQAALSAEEADFPLAFSIAMYTDVEQMERLLRAIYQPQNLYCIHVDTKSSLLIHRTVAGIARCFDNVWVATHLDKIKWGDVSVLLPEINCMRDLIRYYRRRFRYFINLTGQEFPLRTNLELVRIARIFNGSNDIAGSITRMDMERVNYRWTHRWSKTYQQTIFYNTFAPKAPFHANVTFFKGELHALFSRRMVEYLVEDDVARSYLDWCWDSGHPSEHYWNTLNYNAFLGAPGGYEGPLDVSDEYSPEPIIRVKNWSGLYGDRKCHGRQLRGICVYGIGDAPWLATRREMFANKFQLTYEYPALDCLEERHRNRTAARRPASDFDEDFYRRLPTVVYGRKDGLP